jgi:hypothetical protein
MSDAKPKFANFPERDLKVEIGQNINALTTKTLTRMSIGTYEMSFTQQEKGTATAEAARSALNGLARAMGMKMESEPSRDFVTSLSAHNLEHKYNVWVTTPFEPTQANHIVWAKYAELQGEKKVGVAFKLANTFSADDVANIIRAAQKNAIVLAPGDVFTLKGNPPPRFKKKTEGAAPSDASAAAPSEPAPKSEA